MKIRNGFVSNSSSSSFIIGIAKVANERKLKEILEQLYKSDFMIKEIILLNLI